MPTSHTSDATPRAGRASRITPKAIDDQARQPHQPFALSGLLAQPDAGGDGHEAGDQRAKRHQQQDEQRHRRRAGERQHADDDAEQPSIRYGAQLRPLWEAWNAAMIGEDRRPPAGSCPASPAAPTGSACGQVMATRPIRIAANPRNAVAHQARCSRCSTIDPTKPPSSGRSAHSVVIAPPLAGGWADPRRPASRRFPYSAGVRAGKQPGGSNMSLTAIPVVLAGAVLALGPCGKGQGAGSPLDRRRCGRRRGFRRGCLPEPLPLLDPRSVAGGGGYVECQGGWFARPNLAACQTGGATPEPGQGCTRDSDCTAGRICACLNGTSPGTCLESGCTTDGDCLPGFRCASGITGRSDSAFWRFQCQRPEDACVQDQDCPPVDGGPARLYACQSPPAGRRCE